MHALVKSLAVLLILSTVPAVAAEPIGPTERVAAVASRLFAVLQSGPAAAAGANPDQAGFEARVYSELAEIVDFKAITRSVLGKHRNSLTEAQTVAFQREFEKSIVHILAVVFGGMADYTLEVEAAKIKKATRAQVAVNVATATDKYEILFSMVLKSEWRVGNLIVNGINLGLIYRNQFHQAMLSQGGNVEAVIDGWIEVSSDAAKK